MGRNMKKSITRLIHRLTPRPKALLYEATPRCNLNCKFCYNVWKKDLDYPRGEMDTARATKLLARVIKESACEVITITGGEPFVRKDIPEICSFLRACGVRITIITNGTLCDRTTLGDCAAAGVELLEFPLLSADRDTHNSLVRGDAFDKVLNAIANTRASRIAVATTFIITKKNLDALADTLELNAALGVDGILLNRFNLGGEGLKHIDELMPDLQDVKRALRAADDAAEKWGLNISCSVPVPQCLVDRSEYKNLRFGDCPWGTDDMYFTIDPVGNLRPCNHSRTILGSLREETYPRLTNSERMKCLARAKPAICDDCGKYKTCHAGCKAAAEACYGTHSEPDPFLKRNSPVRIEGGSHG